MNFTEPLRLRIGSTDHFSARPGGKTGRTDGYGERRIELDLNNYSWREDHISGARNK